MMTAYGMYNGYVLSEVTGLEIDGAVFSIETIVKGLASAGPAAVLAFDEGRLLWTEVTPGGKDVCAPTAYGEYVISVDHENVGSTHYLWVAGENTDEGREHDQEYRNMRDAKAGAQEHYKLLLANKKGMTNESE